MITTLIEESLRSVYDELGSEAVLTQGVVTTSIKILLDEDFDVEFVEYKTYSVLASSVNNLSTGDIITIDGLDKTIRSVKQSHDKLEFYIGVSRD